MVGQNDTVMTVIETEKRGLGEDVVKEGELYQFVERVNRALMDAEQRA